MSCVSCQNGLRWIYHEYLAKWNNRHYCNTLNLTIRQWCRWYILPRWCQFFQDPFDLCALNTDCVQIDGLLHERRNSIANVLELRLSCTNLSNWRNNINASLWCHEMGIPMWTYSLVCPLDSWVYHVENVNYRGYCTTVRATGLFASSGNRISLKITGKMGL